MLILLTPEPNACVSLLNDAARQMRLTESLTPEDCKAGECWCLLKPAGIELSAPRPVFFTWCLGREHDAGVMKFVLHISKTPDFMTERTVTIEKASAARVYNLEIGQTYYWYVESVGEVAEGSTVSSFSTADELPRAILLPGGISNVRDIGGAVTFDGKRVRQGLFYRGAALGGAPWTEEMIDVFCRDLGIKTEVDLRGSDENCAPEQVTPKTYLQFVNFSIIQYEGTVREGQQEIYGKLFHLLAQKEHYPVYVHCAVGYDRTGTVSALLQYLLRVPEDVIYEEYIYSSLASQEWSDRGHERIDYLMQVLCELTGETDHYRAVEQYLLQSAAFSNEDRTALRRIFLPSE